MASVVSGCGKVLVEMGDQFLPFFAQMGLENDLLMPSISGSVGSFQSECTGIH